MGFIISELDDIKDKCGDEVEMGKINNYTVHMILAKMYLNHNAWFDDHSDDSYYRKCVDELNVIIESNKFSLAPNYADNLRRTSLLLPRLSSGFRLSICMPVAIIVQFVDERGRACHFRVYRLGYRRRSRLAPVPGYL